jgi:hypothetical protein
MQRGRDAARTQDLDPCARAYCASCNEILDTDRAAAREQLAETFHIHYLVFLTERVLEAT